MAFYTKEEARVASRVQNTYATESLLESAALTEDTDTFDIFLSHSVLDAQTILGVKRMLEGQGFDVYVDWLEDSQLDRTSVTYETAEKLRTRMNQCRSLIYVATKNASSSRWMPWELGYFDGSKHGHVAILPLTDNANDSFEGQEYLGLYPLVTKGKSKNGEPLVYVNDRRKRWSSLAKFGKGRAIWNDFV